MLSEEEYPALSFKNLSCSLSRWYFVFSTLSSFSILVKTCFWSFEALDMFVAFEVEPFIFRV